MSEETPIEARKRELRVQITGSLSHGFYTRESGPFVTMSKALLKLSVIELDALAVLIDTSLYAAEARARRGEQ